MGKKKVVTQSGDAAAVEGAASAQGGSALSGKAPVARKAKRLVSGRIYVNASYNNTVVSVTDSQGNLVHWASAGSIGFSGPQKATPFAASKIIAVITEKVKPLGLTNVEVLVKGVGGGRDSAVRSLINQGFTITSIKDVTPIPHNGPRPRKLRRV